MAGKKKEINRIAVIRLDRVGDLILTTPAITLLKDIFPSAFITAFVSEYTHDILTGNPHIGEIIPVKINSAFSAFWTATKFKFKSFDLAFVFSPHTSSYAFAFGLGASKRVGYTYISRIFTRIFASFLLTHWASSSHEQANLDKKIQIIPHEIEQNIALVNFFKETFLKNNCVNEAGLLHIPDLLLPIEKDDVLFASEFLLQNGINPENPLLGIHLTIRWKNSFSSENMESFIKELAKNWDGDILITAGPMESGWLKEIEPVIKEVRKKLQNKILIAHSLPLKKWAALISNCRTVVSPDTGSTHVASAMKVPVLVIMEERFFAYHSQRWAPWKVPYVIVKKPCAFFCHTALDFNCFLENVTAALHELQDKIQLQDKEKTKRSNKWKTTKTSV